MTLAATQYPLLDLLWTFVLFFALMIYFWLLITVFGDLFRRRDISGGAKVGWTVLVLVLPLVGALVYLIAQGRGMAERDIRQASRARQQTDEYIRSVAAPGYRGLDEVVRAKELLDRGAINQGEFDELKRRALV